MSKKEVSKPLVSQKSNSKVLEQRENPDKLREALKDEQKKAEDYLTRLKYLQADFENFQRRSLNELRAVSESGVRSLITKLLNVLDELDCAVEVGKKMNGNEAMLEGLTLVRKKFMTLLQSEGLARIEAIGEQFDPHKHEAVLRVEVENVKDEIILEEIRAGYTFKGKVIRPSLVKVAVFNNEKEVILDE